MIQIIFQVRHSGLGQFWFNFDSGRVWVNRFLVQYACHAKISKFVENFELDMVQFESIWVSGPLLGESISDTGSGMGPGRSV